MGKAFIGTSGYNYKHWRGDFYPERLPTRHWLSYYAQRFDTVEINYTFYRLPLAKTFASWRTQVPADFRFVIKGSRFLTHMRRLKDAGEGIERLREASRPLLDKILVVLWQLPPQMRADLPRLQDFLQELSGLGEVRHAFEFRHPSWFTDGVYRALEDAGATLSFADGRYPVAAPGMKDARAWTTAPILSGWAYVRRHGPWNMYQGTYPQAQIEADARWVRQRRHEGRDVFVYYNNDLGGHAPRNASSLVESLEPRPAAPRRFGRRQATLEERRVRPGAKR